MSQNLVFISFLIILLSDCLNSSSPEWDYHDVSTLKLLQIVHRHAERTPLKDNIPKTDPIPITNWQEGLGQLTKEGKARMFTIGKNLRYWYNDYLSKNNPDNSPRFVYARSSLEHRCIESVSTLLSGMYPPKDLWQWQQNGLGKIWQPFPIETFMPKDEDTVLVPHKPCPKANEEHDKISNSATVKGIIKNFQNLTIYEFLKELFQDPIDSLYRGQMYWDTLTIEKEHGYFWPQFNEKNWSAPYSQAEAIAALEVLGIGSYAYDWNTDFIRRIRLGKLIETLISNMNSVLSSQKSDQQKDLYIYSTHDSIVVPLMQALGTYNMEPPSYGGALLFELHHNPDTNLSFVQIYYYNDTDSKPYPFAGLDKTLSLQDFESANKKWFYTDFDSECGLQEPTLLLEELTFMVIGIAIGVGLTGLNIFALKYIRSRNNSPREIK